MKRTILSLVSMAFICAMTLTSCDEIMSAIDNPVGSYVQFKDSVLNLTPGQVAQNEATTISTEKVTYTSSDKSIATVDPNGFVTAIAFGEAIITASVPANENYQAGSASYKVKVGSVLQKALKNGADVEIVLQDGENKIAPKFVNENNVFTLQNPLAGANSTLTYDKAKNLITFTQQVVVLPASETVITVIFDVTNNTYQVIPALSTTTAQFAAIKIYGDDVTGKVTKKEVAATAVTITDAPSPFVMAIGDADVTLKAEVTPADATDKKVTWSSSAPAVATVDQTGKVHAVAAGTATIKAVTSNGKEATVELTVSLSKATVTTAPTAKTGIKAGENAAIINAGVASGGTMMYKVTTTNTKPTTTDGFSATVPTAQNLAAGTCYVWYYVKADATHADSDIAGPVQVTIASAIISTKDVSETFTPTANTVTKTYFKVSGFKFLYGWRLGYNGNTITISSPDGLNLSQVVFTVNNQPNMSGRNKSHLQVDHGTLTVTGTSQGSTITISGINSPSVTLSAPSATSTTEMWSISQAVVDGKGDASK